MDICNEKKFIDLNDDLYIRYKNDYLDSITDSDNNCWIREKNLGSGSYGEVLKFKSMNKEYCDLAIKLFRDLKVEREEINIILFFEKNKCKNFINIGVKEINQKNRLIIMEKVSGDLIDFRFSNFKNPISIYQQIVKFLADSYKCAYKHGKYFLDIKEENIGFKVCSKNDIKFCFLDFGSFTDISEKSSTSTFTINYKRWKENFFSNETVLIYSIIILLLSLRLKVVDLTYHKKFSNYIYSKLEKIKKYPKINLLSIDNYNKIKEKFYKYFKEEDLFVKMLFEYLYKLTEKEIDINKFFNRLDFFQ